MQSQSEIGVLIIVTTILIFTLAAFIVTILYLYKKKQISFLKNIDAIKLDYERDLLKTQLEIQEQTSQNISRDIHDNIGLSLTLAKLNLNTINYRDYKSTEEKVSSSIDLIGKTIEDLNDISKSLDSQLIEIHGLIKVLEMEIKRINKIGTCNIELKILGDSCFLNLFKEIIIFRIVQEALNNILKHSKASYVLVKLEYSFTNLVLILCDNGIGFELNPKENVDLKCTAGLKNIQQRSKLISAECFISSKINEGSLITIRIPLNSRNE